MAAASSIQPPSVHALKRENSPHPESDSPESRHEEDAASEGITILRDLPELDPEEIERRLEKTRRELSNRRKILIKNLPPDTTNQEVHDILREYELKYCFVDRNKGTAFVTLLNGDQAQDAIRTLHQMSVRGRDITVQLQPTDSLLCVTNLPYTVTAAQFQELVRSYGNIERSFLVYSDLTGHSKGYGFVEYMKKDSASRARSELLGKPLGDRALMVQWADVNQLTSADHLHSKCLCVDRLPLDFEDSEELAHIFSEHYKPVFCQLAQDEGSPVRGFAVVEYETAEQAEAVLLEMDRQLIQGQEIRLCLCPPGTTGRSTLAALIAAQGVMLSNKKGLLPEPNLAQLLNSMTNPAALHVLMRPYLTGKRGGKFGRPHNLPFLHPPLTTALLQLGKAQQNAILGNGLVLQNLLHMQMAQQQLLHIKDKHVTNARVPGLLGDPSRLLLQKVLGLRAPAAIPLGKGLLGDSPTELGQDSSPVTSQGGGSGTGLVSHVPGRSHISCTTEQNGVTATSTALEKQPTPPGTTGGSISAQAQLQNFHPGINTQILGSLLGSTMHKAPANHHSTSPQTSTSVTTQSSCQTSLLGDPPKEVKLPSNPYLNLASVLPGVVLQAPCNSKPQTVQTHSGTYSAVLPPATNQPSQYSTETTPAEYTHQYTQQYTQEAMQQWYQHYQAQTYANTSQETAAVTECTKEQPQVVVTSSYGDYNSYMHAVSQYYSHTQMSQAAAQVYQHRDVSKEVEVLKTPLSAPLNGSAQPLLPTYSALPIMPGFITPTHTPSPVTHAHSTPTDWNQYYYSQARGQKREYSTLPTQEVTSDGAYVGQHSQGLGGQYADYYKKKRI
ncbi:ribonucleoprotein PTB-binding 2-like [Myxocyprinus asiaticus]|uniref:ribonucleoprotein PTB-binding 2-like n=1 Tax=Myxocyprinus asiaticus TaxID=70543 RepID=UPI00222341CD|nr:ribonucleoprotein PTB-binding 2-like [Myxocyprinus asiaticus]